MERRVAWAALVVLAALPSAFFAWRYRAMPQLGHFHDDGVYVVTAQSLAQGNSYKILSLPGQPHQIKYPPLFPTLLSAGWVVDGFPRNLPWVTLICWLALPIMLGLVWRFYRQAGFDAARAAVLCAIIGLSPYTVLLSASAMSEVVATSLVMASLVLVMSKRPGWAGVAAGAAYLARTAGVALVAVPLWYVFRKNRRAAIIFAGSMLPATIVWQFWVMVHPPSQVTEATMFYASYGDFYAHNLALSDLPRVVWMNLGDLLAGMGGLVLFTPDKGMFDVQLLRLIGIASISGLVRIGRRTGWAPYHLFAAAYMLMMLPWHYPPHERFVFPLFPLMLAGLSEEMSHLARMLRQSWQRREMSQRVVAGGIAVAVVAVGAVAVWRGLAGLVSDLPILMARHAELLQARSGAYDWIRRNLRPDASFVAYDDPSLFLHTGRAAVGMHFPTRLHYRGDRQGVIDFFAGMPEFARRHGFQYLLLTPADFEQDLSAEERATVRARIDADRRLEMLYDSGGVSVRRVGL